MSQIRIKRELCMSCMNCILGCMMEHNCKGRQVDDLDLSDPANEGRCHLGQDSHAKSAPILCQHCDQPECAYACMSGAMAKDEVTGRVTYDSSLCAACFMCVSACPYGVLKADALRSEKVMKCDLCGDQAVPRCVESCPTGCLHWE